MLQYQMLGESPLKKKNRPPQVENLIEAIKQHLETGNIRFSEHAITRKKERRISPQDAVYVLRNGYHEKRKTTFDELNNTWKYAVRGKTLDKEDLRIVVAIVDEVVVITVIRLK